jgi:hypothetical protein
MWTCSHCGEMSEDNFDSCWQCGTGQDGTPSAETGSYAQQQAQMGPAFDTPCPICGGLAYSWDNGAYRDHPRFQAPQTPLWRRVLEPGGPALAERRCDGCGNVQLFDHSFLVPGRTTSPRMERR